MVGHGLSGDRPSCRTRSPEPCKSVKELSFIQGPGKPLSWVYTGETPGRLVFAIFAQAAV